MINAGVTATSLTNYAEITEVENELEADDQDSTPGDNQGLDESGTDDDINDEFPGTPGNEDNPADNDDYDLAIVPLCATEVVAGDPQTTCGSAAVSLSGSISPANTSGTWSTSGDGTFTEDEAGATVTSAFETAAFYQPGPGDISAGTVILTLTSGGHCPAEASTVEVTILQVDCGSFFWEGN